MQALRITMAGMLLWLWVASWQTLATVNDDIMRYFPSEQIVTLNALDKQIAALSRPATTPLKRGIAIILVDASSQSLNVDGGLILADTLTEKGWQCLLIPFEQPALKPVETGEAPPKPIDDTPSMAVDYERFYSAILSRVNAAYGVAQQYKGYTFIVAEGMASAVLLDAIQRNAIDMPDTLISLGAFWPEHDKNQQVVAWLAQSSYPILDLDLPMLSQWQASTTDARQIAARVNLKRHYRQRSLVQSAGLGSTHTALPNPSGAWLAQEIYSWLRYLGW